MNAGHPHVAGLGQIVPDDQSDTLGHGTAAAAAILHLAPGSELHSLKVFDSLPHCPFETVLEALEESIALQPKLINLSLGTTRNDWNEALVGIIARLHEHGITLVSPATAGGLPSFPGSLAGVTGVLMDATLPRERPELRETGEHRFWYASPYPRDLPNLPRGANLAGISMAAANLTGYLARH